MMQIELASEDKRTRAGSGALLVAKWSLHAQVISSPAQRTLSRNCKLAAPRLVAVSDDPICNANSKIADDNDHGS